MSVIDKAHRLLTGWKRDGLGKVTKKVFVVARDYVSPPWYKLYWIPVPEVPQPESMCNIPAGHESFYKLAGRLIQGVKLRVVRNLGDLDSHQMAALTECVGTSALPVFRERLSKGVELHMLLSENRVVGTVFFVLGKSHSFQHIPLTERDAMGLDGRIDPAFRGRGLYPILLLVSLLDFKNRGIERVYTDCAEWNKETIRSFECVGFRYLLKYRLRRGFYRFEQEVF